MVSMTTDTDQWACRTLCTATERTLVTRLSRPPFITHTRVTATGVIALTRSIHTIIISAVIHLHITQSPCISGDTHTLSTISGGCTTVLTL